MRRYLPALLAGSIATAAAIVLMSATGQDDAHITFWAARALARHGTIINYNGERIEQSSSLLFTVVLAVLHRLLPLTLPTIAYLVGIAAGVLAAVRVATHTHGGRFLAALVVASAPLLGYWMLSGMETTLHAWLLVELALLGDAVLRGRTKPWGPRAVTVIACVVCVRPEGFLVAGSALAALTIVLLVQRLRRGPPAGWEQIRRSLMLLGLAVVAFTVVTAFRLRFFGAAFPHPVLAKSSAVDRAGALRGLRYLWAQLSRVDVLPLAAAVAISVALVARALRRGGEIEPDRCLALLIVLAQASFVVAVGGDWMAAGRFVAFVVPLLSLLLLCLLRDARLRPRTGAMAALAVITLNATGLVEVAKKESPGRPLWIQLRSDPAIVASSNGFEFPWVDRANQTHTRDTLFIGALSSVIDRIRARKDPVVVMSGQAGMVMYYIASLHEGHVRFIDRRGLVTSDLDRWKRELRLPGTGTGLDLSVEGYFDIARREPSLIPDVVFDLDHQDKSDCRAEGYITVHEQRGQMSPNRPERPGPIGPDPGGHDGPFRVHGRVYEFAVVRPELAPLFADHPEPATFEWNAGPR